MQVAPVPFEDWLHTHPEPQSPSFVQGGVQWRDEPTWEHNIPFKQSAEVPQVVQIAPKSTQKPDSQDCPAAHSLVGPHCPSSMGPVDCDPSPPPHAIENIIVNTANILV